MGYYRTGRKGRWDDADLTVFDVASVTIELKDVKTADHEEAEQARKVARLKKGLAD